jgi:acylphosphatase
VRLHLLVRGRVQGVGFRWYVRELARKLGLSGWVRNCPDGAVEIAAEGSEEPLQRLQRELRIGPPGAVVSSVEDLDPLDQLHDHPFAIMR